MDVWLGCLDTKLTLICFLRCRCLDELFYYARVDNRFNQTCENIMITQYVFVGVLTFILIVQVGSSLVYIARRPPFVKDDDMRAGVMITVPCYNESDQELRKTIDSILLNDYPDENKILVVVADGVITGKDQTMSCPETLANILGFEFDPADAAYPYKSLGAKRTNYASIYSGTYRSPKKDPSKHLKYIVVVKQGGDEERYTARAGNRGKRDSQLLLYGIFNRLQYKRQPTKLDLTFMVAMDELGLPLGEIEYMMAIDADTRVSHTAMKYLVHRMESDKSILASCGETRVDNRSQSFTTMIQVFEYYSAHHMKKAFESVFGCVTCLPGCFTMYRLYTEELQPLLTSDAIVREYSRNDISSLHERNLYELGEDRMLTTLMLQHFYGMTLSFVPEATCWTIVPHTFQILKSQRRRWINSTIHNMLELLKVQTMCGVCFFSMKMIVIFDLVSTFVLPSGCVYLYYIVFNTVLKASSSEAISVLDIIAFAYIGMMTVPFIMRAQWDYFIWFFLFIIGGIPTFYFYLPIYSFWNMDDLSWGKTRQVKTDTDTDGAVKLGGEAIAGESLPAMEEDTKRSSMKTDKASHSTSSLDASLGEGSPSTPKKKTKKKAPSKGTDGGVRNVKKKTKSVKRAPSIQTSEGTESGQEMVGPTSQAAKKIPTKRKKKPKMKETMASSNSLIDAQEGSTRDIQS